MTIKVMIRSEDLFLVIVAVISGYNQGFEYRLTLFLIKYNFLFKKMNFT